MLIKHDEMAGEAVHCEEATNLALMVNRRRETRRRRRRGMKAEIIYTLRLFW
jgi:hypothetical protein